MPNFSGTLRSNEVYAALFNMIISQQVFADNIAGTNATLVDAARTDGGLYGDTKLYYSTDVLKTHKWGGHKDEAANLLSLDYADAPKCQSIVLDQFRQIRLTTDEYLSKRAWGTEGAFSQFNSVMLGWISDTKRVYDSTLYNTFIGTHETAEGRQEIEITVPATVEGEALTEIEARNRLVAQTIAEAMANLMVDLQDVSRDFNDYGFLRSYDSSSLIAVWNSEVVNKIDKMDLPMIYHELGIDKKAEYTLPARYFGKVIATASSENSGKGDGKTIRTLVEKDYGTKHCFPGDLIPANETFEDGEAYKVDSSIAFKIMHRGSVPFMSAFSTSTSFFNPRSLTENRYLTWGYNTLEHLENYPFITVRLKEAAAAKAVTK